METLLKIKGLWKYTKVVIPDPTYDQTKFMFDGKKDDVVGVIITYNSWKIRFHLSGIDCPHYVWNNMKSFFNRVNKIHVMELEKELISLNPHSFDKMEDYLSCVKEL
jgi:hypothetical protein